MARKTTGWVLVPLCDGIKFVVVTPRTLQAQPEQRVAGQIRHIGLHLRPLRLDVPLVVLLDAVPEIHRRDQCVPVAGVNFIPGQLLANKPVVRFIGVG